MVWQQGGGGGAAATPSSRNPAPQGTEGSCVQVTSYSQCDIIVQILHLISQICNVLLRERKPPLGTPVLPTFCMVMVLQAPIKGNALLWILPLCFSQAILSFWSN